MYSTKQWCIQAGDGLESFEPTDGNFQVTAVRQTGDSDKQVATLTTCVMHLHAGLATLKSIEA